MAFAESFTCYPVQRGDTASRVAKRITGDASNKYQPWFDIVDVKGRSVPKSQYDRVRSGWRACIREAAVQSSPPGAGQVVTDEAPRQAEAVANPASANAARLMFQDGSPPSVVALRTRLNVSATDLWLGGAVVVPALGFLIAGEYMRRRNSARIFMIQFAYLFVREFERPLLQDAAEPALRVHFRVSPYRARLEICLAPGNGRRYPNLSDHRKNVEYDVNRVLMALADESFVCGQLQMREGWVVVPFRFSARLKHQGIRCISSL